MRKPEEPDYVDKMIQDWMHKNQAQEQGVEALPPITRLWNDFHTVLLGGGMPETDVDELSLALNLDPYAKDGKTLAERFQQGVTEAESSARWQDIKQWTKQLLTMNQPNAPKLTRGQEILTRMVATLALRQFVQEGGEGKRLVDEFRECRPELMAGLSREEELRTLLR